ncbi:hypothetical protein Tco_0607151 [Tanacetum coccineum]
MGGGGLRNRMTLLCEISTSWSQENVHANPSSIIESLPVSLIPVEDSEPVQEEIDIFPVLDDINPPGVENDDRLIEDNRIESSSYADRRTKQVGFVEFTPCDRPNFSEDSREDHAFEVEPLRNVGQGAGSQKVKTQDLIDYHSTRDREDSNEDASAVDVVEKIYAHKSLTFDNTFSCEVISKWKARLKDDMDARSDVKGECTWYGDHQDQSGNNLKVSQSRLYNRKLVQTLLEGHFILLLEGSLSGDCDVENNGKWSYTYAIGIHVYQGVCTRLDITSANVESGAKLQLVAVCYWCLDKGGPWSEVPACCMKLLSIEVLIGGNPQGECHVNMKKAQGMGIFTLESLSEKAQDVTITDCHAGNPFWKVRQSWKGSQGLNWLSKDKPEL